MTNGRTKQTANRDKVLAQVKVEETGVPTPVQWIRDHAVYIAALIDSPWSEDSLHTVRIWRALYITRDGVIAASIHQERNKNLLAQAQLRYSHGAYSPSQLVQGAALTATEVAVFLGLDDVPPDSIRWVEQKFAPRGGGLVVPQGPIEGLRAN